MPFAERDMLVTFPGGAHSVEPCIWGVSPFATGIAGVSGSKMTEAELAIQVIIC